MSIEQNIVDAITLSKETRIPVLFMSNPGLGKTTIMKRYALKNNLHLETLIGSRFTPEEISGYQVNNGQDHLTHLNPDWFNRILEKEKEGISTLLFLDEISTCSETVQGSLLSLIFDRTIGSGKYLPQDCIIISAANYSGNLPAMMNIMAPTLNRFAIVNLNQNYNALDLINEFLNEPAEPVYYSKAELKEEDLKDVKDRFSATWRDIFVKYSDPESSLGILDIGNPQLDGLYSESERAVFNFISGRTLSYLLKIITAYKTYKMDNIEILFKLTDGLVGAGTCSFKETKQLTNYQNFVHKQMQKLLKSSRKNAVKKIEIVNDISTDVASYMMNLENLDFTPEENLKQLMSITKEITDKFNITKVIEECQNEVNIAKFISDMDAIIELRNAISQFPDAKNLCAPLNKVSMNYYGLYCDIMDIKTDFFERFNVENKLFKKIVYLKRKDGSKTGISKAGLRFVNNSKIPYFYLINKEDSLLEANLKQQIPQDAILGVLVYKDKAFKFITLKEYLEEMY